jgi:hypothetical protein
MKIFLIEDFFHLPPVSTTPVVHLELRISPGIFKKSHGIVPLSSFLAIESVTACFSLVSRPFFTKDNLNFTF